MDQHAGSPGRSTYCYAELTVLTALTHGRMTRHPSSTSSITARHLLDFVVQGKIAEAEAPIISLGATFPHLHHLPFYYAECPFCSNPPNLSWLGTGTE